MYLYVNLFYKPFCIRSENPKKIPATEFMVFKKSIKLEGKYFQFNVNEKLKPLTDISRDTLQGWKTTTL